MWSQFNSEFLEIEIISFAKFRDNYCKLIILIVQACTEVIFKASLNYPLIITNEKDLLRKIA